MREIETGLFRLRTRKRSNYGSTVKTEALVAEPPAFVTVIAPLVAPAGTVAVTVFVDFMVKEAELPLNVTLFVPTKLLPEIVTFCPTGPLAGQNRDIAGFGFGKLLLI